jgi:hypothetical protein
MRRILLLSAIVLPLLCHSATAQERATTTSGTRLLLYPNGSWAYDSASKPGRWDLEENWHRVRSKMTPEQLRKLLGEPARISETDVPTIIFWHYPKGGRVEINLKAIKGDSLRATRKLGVQSWIEPDWNASLDTTIAGALERARTAKGKSIVIYQNQTWKPASVAFAGNAGHPLNWRALRGRMSPAQVKKLLGAPEREEKHATDPVVLWHYPNGGRIQLFTRTVAGAPAGVASWTEPSW